MATGKFSLPPIGTNASAGRPSYEVDPSPIRYAEIDPSCYDPGERLRVMDQDGVLASLLFPTLPRFCGQEFYEGRDK